VTETVVRMPKLADTLVEGTVGQWLKKVGEEINSGEPLASIETDKVTTELTSPVGGTLLELLVPEGRAVPVETPIARIGAATESAPQRKTTPVAARLLAEHGLTPDQIPSQSLRLKRDDVLAYVNQSRPLTTMRRAIAEHMTRAYQSIPHGQTVMSADLTDLVAWREANKAKVPNLTFTALFVYALGRTLESPAHIGVAVALPTGLVVPVIRNTQDLGISEIANSITDVSTRARSNRLKPDETQGARMTLTNVGSFGNLTASPIIPLGQPGILAPGLVERRPVPESNGGIRAGWRCLFAFVFDRRAYDDLAADRFLRGVISNLRAIPV